jgi:hypothetical protein
MQWSKKSTTDFFLINRRYSYNAAARGPRSGLGSMDRYGSGYNSPHGDQRSRLSEHRRSIAAHSIDLSMGYLTALERSEALPADISPGRTPREHLCRLERSRLWGAIGAVPLSWAAALRIVKYTFTENYRVLRVNYKVKPPSGGS